MIWIVEVGYKDEKFDPLFHQPWGIQVEPDTLEDEWGIRRQLNATKT